MEFIMVIYNNFSMYWKFAIVWEKQKSKKFDQFQLY